MKITKETYRTFFLCLMIAFVIFVTSIFSNLSVQMYDLAQQPQYVGYAFFICIGTILAMAFVIWVGFTQVPTFKKAMIRMFGMDEEPIEKKTDTTKKVTQRGKADRK
jgi:hypothetical protein